MTVNLAQLRAFVAVVDEGGFGAAAPVLGISQSAVSHAIAALERSVGAPVLHRCGTVRPTSFGSQLLGPARDAIAAAEAITGLAAEQSRSPAGLVRLAAPPSACQGLLPPLLTWWLAEFPRVTIRVFEGEDDEVADWLRAGTVEAAVLVNPDPPQGAVIGTDTFQALLRTDHPLAGETEVNLADLADDPLLLCSCGGCERQLHDLYRRAGLRLAPAHWISELTTQLAMVRSGLGVSIVPGLVQSMLGDGLVLVPLRPTASRRLALTGPVGRPWHPALTALISSAEARLRGAAVSGREQLRSPE